jgi:integrase/recombinase XerD
MTVLEQLVSESRRLRPYTKETYLRAVRAFVEFAGESPTGWTPLAVDRWAQHLAKQVAPQSVNTYLNGIKAASRRWHQVYEGIDFAKSIEKFKFVQQVQPQRALNRSQVATLLATCNGDGFAEVRDRAILLLGLRAGLRRSEICSLRWDGLKEAKLTFVGKGGRLETVDLDEPTLAAIRRWHRTSVRKGCPYIFFRTRPILSAPLQPLTPGGLHEVVQARSQQAGVVLTSHTLRHTHITLAIQAGVPLWRVQKSARHRSPITTTGYVHDIEADAGHPVGESLGDLDHPEGK